MNDPSKIEVMVITPDCPKWLRIVYFEGDALLKNFAQRCTHVQWTIAENFISSANVGDHVTIWIVEDHTNSIVVRIK